jgi:CRP-like cAMP-binding protein/HEAT repeat protein
MAAPDISKKMLDALNLMNLAVTHIRLYPSASPIIANSVNRAYQSLISALSQDESVIITEFGKSYLISGQSLTEKDQRKNPQAMAFLETIFDLGLKSVKFMRDVRVSELRQFLEIVGKSAEIEHTQELLRQSHTHILADYKASSYVPNENRLLTDVGIQDEDILRHFTGDKLLSDSELQKVRGMAKSPEWAEKAFQIGMDHIMERRAGMTVNKLAQIIVHMVRVLDDLLDDSGKEKLSIRISNLMSDMDDDTLSMIMSQDTEGLLGGRFSEGLRALTYRVQEKMERLARIREGVRAILSGDTSRFADNDLMHAIPGIIDDMVSEGKTDSADDLIRKLSLWIRSESQITSASVKIYAYLGQVTRNKIREFRFEESEAVLESLYTICYKMPEKDEDIRRLSENTLKDIGTEEILSVLSEEFKHNHKGQQKAAGLLLTRFGGLSAEHLLDILKKSESRTERAQLLKLIPDIGAPAIPSLRVRIGQGGAWYYLRNIILILGKIGSEDDVVFLKPLLNHEDFRIKQEAVNSIYSIGGKYRGEILLSALPSADDAMKSVLTDMLGGLHYANAVPVLLEMLESKSLFSSKLGDKFKEKICHALGRIGDLRAVPKLKEISDQKNLLGISSYSDGVKAAAANALSEIRRAEAKKHESPQPKPALKTPAKVQKPTPEKTDIRLRLSSPPKSETSTVAAEFRLRQPSEKKVTIVSYDHPSVSRNAQTIEESTVRLMFEQIAALAREKKFDQAEALREKMIETDPMALSEIVRSAEIIEMEKNDFFASEHDVNLWPDLDENLSLEESNALYQSMEEIVYEANQPVFVQGERNNRLYFIRYGQLKMIWRQGKQERLLKTLSPGDIAGEDSFFSITFCTTSLIAISRVKMNFIHKDILNLWKEQYPQLESKLYEYCFPSLESFYQLLKRKDIERRTQKRILMTGQLSLQLFNTSGAPEGREFKGQLRDISAGGLAFSIKTSEKTAQILLGRKLGITAILSSKNIQQKLDVSGTVISVVRRYASTYSIHVRFDTLLKEQVMGNIENIRTDGI